jgi:hypothetical protein
VHFDIFSAWTHPGIFGSVVFTNMPFVFGELVVVISIDDGELALR